MGLRVPTAPSMGWKNPPNDNDGAAPPPLDHHGIPDPPPTADHTASTRSTPDSAPLGRGPGREYTRQEHAASRGGERKDNAATPHAELGGHRRGHFTPLRPPATAELEQAVNASDTHHGRLTTPLCHKPVSRSRGGPQPAGLPFPFAASPQYLGWGGRGGTHFSKPTSDGPPMLGVGATSKDIPVSRSPYSHPGRGGTRRHPLQQVHNRWAPNAWGGAGMGTTEFCGELRTERRMEPADKGEGIYRLRVWVSSEGGEAR